MADNIKDESKVDEFLKVLDDLSRTHVEIGIIGDGEKYKGNNITVLGVATVHEFGVNIDVTDKMRGYLHSIGIHLKETTKQINIPERSFIRNSWDENKEKIFNFEKELEKVLSLELSVEAFFTLLGEWGVGVIQKYLTELSSPPNHPATVERKKSSNPLISTGQLRNSISYQIIRK